MGSATTILINKLDTVREGEYPPISALREVRVGFRVSGLELDTVREGDSPPISALKEVRVGFRV